MTMLSVCVCPQSNFWTNSLIVTKFHCHLAPPYHSNSQINTISNNYMVEAKTSEVGATLAPVNTGAWNNIYGVYLLPYFLMYLFIYLWFI